MRLHPTIAAPCLTWLLLTCGCASVPVGQYAVESVEFSGVEQMDADALSRCLLTVERGSFGLVLGMAETDCAEPPFDSSAPVLELWTWPWTDWPAFNAAVLRVDKARVGRWYQARGFYDAEVVEVRVVPKAAVQFDADNPACDPNVELCTAAIEITVREGTPLSIADVRVDGIEKLPESLQRALRSGELPQVSARFDEVNYDRGKDALAERMAEAGYPDARVTGDVRLDHVLNRADVNYHVATGAQYRFGSVRVEGNDILPVEPIIAAADVPSGEFYAQSVLGEVQQEVYALGAFSAVSVERELDRGKRLANLLIKVTPLDKHAFRVGVGITSGAQKRTDTGSTESIPQWDIHLSARYEQRHVLNTLGRLRIEDKPRLIYPQQFPGTKKLPRLGNILNVRLNEPGLLEKRTDLVGSAQWDMGPDPFLGFFRSDIALRVAAKRAFFRPLFLGTLAIEHDRMIVHDTTGTTADDRPVSYVYSYLEQALVLDARNDDIQPRRGVYAQLKVTESARLPAISDWTLIGLQGEVRGYVPLPFGMVLAGRFALAANLVLDGSGLTGQSATLGPYSYRLRGGGAQSNRGYLAGQLGVGIAGGTKRWESAAELRIRLGGSLGLVGFFDMGNVTRGGGFQFGEQNPSAGFGLRYLTVIGAIRFDVGFRLKGRDELSSRVLLLNSPGALHLTIGEAF